MTTYQIAAPDGNTYKVDGPAGASDDQVRSEVLKQHPQAAAAKAEGTSKRYSAAGAIGAEVARPILKTAAGIVGMTDPLNAVTGQKSGGLGSYLNRKIDQYLPRPENASSGIETAQELVLGAMTGGSGAAEAGAAEAAKSGEALFRASRFVEERVGIEWEKLAPELKQQLSLIARKPKDLAKLDPKLVAQEAASSKRVSELVQSDLDTLAKAHKLPARSEGEAGAAVQGGMRAQLKTVKAGINQLYDKARADGETEQPVAAKPLADWLSVPQNARGAPWLTSALQDYAKDGKVTVNDLESIRGEANAKAFDKTGSGVHYAVEAKKVIDGILDKSGGATYKAARAAQSAYKNEWVRQGIIRKLSTDKPGTNDPRIALENTVQSVVIRGSAADLGKVKATLVGKPAWQELQAGAVDYLRQAARGKQDPTQFNNSFLDRLHDLDKGGKLSVLFGEDTAGQLRSLAQTVRQLHGAAAMPEQGKESAELIMKILDTTVGHLPVVGKVYQGGRTLYKIGSAVKSGGSKATSVAEAAAKATPRAMSTNPKSLKGTLAPAVARLARKRGLPGATGAAAAADEAP